MDVDIAFLTTQFLHRNIETGISIKREGKVVGSISVTDAIASLQILRDRTQLNFWRSQGIGTARRGAANPKSVGQVISGEGLHPGDKITLAESPTQ